MIYLITVNRFHTSFPHNGFDVWKLWLDVSLSRMFTVVPEYRSTRKRLCSLYVRITGSQIPCGIGTLQFVKEPERLRSVNTCYCTPFQNRCKSVLKSLPRAQASGGGAGGGGGGIWTARHGRHPPNPRGIALKFFQKSSPICPNTTGCQPSTAVNHPRLSTIHGCQPSTAVNVPKPAITAIIALSYFSFRANLTAF